MYVSHKREHKLTQLDLIYITESYDTQKISTVPVLIFLFILPQSLK